MPTNLTYDEDKLAGRIKQGDPQAFRQFYDSHKKAIYAFAYTYLKSKSEAQEVVQVAFVKFWENRENINETLSIKSYLFKITINHIYNLLKRRNFQVPMEHHELNEPIADNSTQQTIQYNNLKEKIENLLNQLPEQRKLIFMMSRYGDLSHDEIARQLGISVRTVESQVYKALKFLKEHLREEILFLILFVIK